MTKRPKRFNQDGSETSSLLYTKRRVDKSLLKNYL